MLSLLNKKNIWPTLKTARYRAFPRCDSIGDFDQMLNNNLVIKSMFGEFRNQKLYRKTINILIKTKTKKKSGKRFKHKKTTKLSASASIFVIQQVLDVLPNKCNLFIDGTFRIIPRFFGQLLIIFAEVDGWVITFEQ